MHSRPYPDLCSALFACIPFKGASARHPKKSMQQDAVLAASISSSVLTQQQQQAQVKPARSKKTQRHKVSSYHTAAVSPASSKAEAYTGACPSPATAVAICEGYPPGSNTSLSPSTTPAAEQTARSRVLTVPTLLTTFLRLDVRPPSSFGLSGRRLTSWLLRGMRSPPSFRGFQPPSECR